MEQAGDNLELGGHSTDQLGIRRAQQGSYMTK